MKTRIENSSLPPKKENLRSQKERFQLGLIQCALPVLLTGCIGYVEHERVYAEPPPVYVPSAVIAEDDYVYYPGYQVYFSSSRHQYVYLEGRSWVWRPAPPRVSVNLLLASPSVRLNFHDSPAAHHLSVVRQYPKHWKPAGPKSNHGQENRDEGKGHGQGNSGK